MSKLAINGGPAEAAKLKEKIPDWPEVNEEDKKALIKAYGSGRWCRIYSGSKSELLEQAFSEYHDAKHGVAVANGTVALELALKTVGVGLGDEVLVPAITFIATASAVTEVGALPLFVDIDRETATMSPEALKNSITDRTKAVIVVHYGGYPANFDEIVPIVKDNNLFLIEDCAHAHGSEWRGRKVGAIGDIGCFSFQESKSLPAGEGGIILTDYDELAERARLIHNIGRVVGRPGYEHYILSSNYRITEFQAALLLSKLKKLPQQTEVRHTNGEYLARELMKIGGVGPLKRDPRITKRGYYFFVIRYDPKEFGGLSKDKFLKALNAEGIPADEGYGMPLYRQPAFKKENLKGVIPEGVYELPNYEKLYLPAAEEFSSGEITLPHEILLADREDMDMIVRTIVKIKENVDELL